MDDISIQCVECGRSFIWSTGEQVFYREHGLQPPKHCKVCLAHRRAQQDEGNRGPSGPPAAGIAPSGADISLRHEQPATYMPLWRSLRHSHEMRLISQFVRLDPATAPTLDAETFTLLMQWMFEQFERETLSAEAHPGYLDLLLHSYIEQREEFARVYYDYEKGLHDSIYDVYDRLGGRHVDRIYLCTFSAFTSHQREVGDQLPIAVDLLEGQALRAHLQEAQQRFRTRLERADRERQVTGEISGPTRPYDSKQTTA